MTKANAIKTEEKLKKEFTKLTNLEVAKKIKIDDSKIMFYLEIIQKLNNKYGNKITAKAPFFIMFRKNAIFVCYKKDYLR